MHDENTQLDWNERNREGKGGVGMTEWKLRKGKRGEEETKEDGYEGEREWWR